MAASDIAVATTSRAIVAHFTNHQATAPLRAMGFNPTQPHEVVLFDRLRSEGVILQASPNLFYVDERRLAARQAEAMVRVAGAGVAAGVLILGLRLLGGRRRRKAEARALRPRR